MGLRVADWFSIRHQRHKANTGNPYGAGVEWIDVAVVGGITDCGCKPTSGNFRTAFTRSALQFAIVAYAGQCGIDWPEPGREGFTFIEHHIPKFFQGVGLVQRGIGGVYGRVGV